MQLDPFKPPPAPAKQPPGKRKDYTRADMAFIREHYTSGLLSGKATAHHLGHTYGSFKQFLFRNPDLMRRRNKKGSR